MGTIHIVFDSHPDDLEFFDHLAETLDAIVERRGTWFPLVRTHDDADGVVRHEYAGPDGEIHVVSDFELGVRYGIVHVDDPDTRDGVLSDLASALPVLQLEELRRRADEAEDPIAFYELGLGAPREFDDATARVIRDGLAADDPLVRFHALQAAGLTQWQGLLSDVARLTSDTSPEVSELAGAVMRTLGMDPP